MMKWMLRENGEIDEIDDVVVSMGRRARILAAGGRRYRSCLDQVISLPLPFTYLHGS